MSDRTEKSKEIVTVGGAAPPDWLATLAETDTSLAEAVKYRVLNRLKLVQSSSNSDLKKKFGEGAVILSPGNTLVAGAEEAFDYVGLMMFTEFCTWSDLDDKTSPTILDRSFDAKSDIALKSRDNERRFEVYGDKEQFKMRHVEHINIAGFVYSEGHPLHGQPVVMSYARGEFNQGRNLLSAMMMRKIGGKQVPLWSQVWRYSSNERDRGGYQWWGYDYEPPEVPYIKQEEAEGFEAMHKELAEEYAKNRLVVDHSDAEDEHEVTVSDNEFSGATP